MIALRSPRGGTLAVLIAVATHTVQAQHQDLKQQSVPLASLLPETALREDFQTGNARIGIPSEDTSSTHSQTESLNLRGDEDHEAIRRLYFETKSRVEILETNLFKNRPDLKAIEGYRSKLEIYYQNGRSFLNALDKCQIVPSVEETRQRMAAIRKLSRLIAAQTISEISELDPFFARLLQPGFEEINKANAQSWQAIYGEILPTKGRIEEKIPSCNGARSFVEEAPN